VLSRLWRLLLFGDFGGFTFELLLVIAWKKYEV
jgi:hypothetical protein